jgi:polysaccharide chain length determinant protein (PEP-CTERM system associated)
MPDKDSLPSMTPADYWSLLVRRKWLVLALFAFCVAGAGILCVVLPKSYRSQTLILVESQKIPENYVQALVGPTIEERLNSIQQQVMSRTVLTQMIQEFDLYPDAVRRKGVEEVIERLRKDISVTTMSARSQRSTSGIDAFSISFAHEDPVTAMKVTAKLASNFIEENLKVREQLVAGASEFLEQELALAKDRLESQERAISLFKTKHMGELPEQIQANISTLDRLGLQQGSTIEALQKASDRLTLIEKMIKEYESPALAGVATVQGPGGTVAVDPLLLRLKELEKTLATLSAEYKESYPDVISTKEEIQALKAQLSQRPREKDESEKPLAPAKDAKSSDLYLRELIRQRDEAKLEIASLKERLLRIKDQVKEYEARVEKAPTREQELMILVRDYNNLKENYRTLLDKKLNARLAENLEKRQKGEQFRILDPANIPTKPEKPDQLKIMLIGLALGCGLGVGGAVGLESLRPVFRRTDDVEGLLQLKVLASIPNYRKLLEENQKFLLDGAAAPSSPAAPRRRLLFSRGPRPGNTYESTRDLEQTGAPAVSHHIMTPAGLNGISREWELITKWSPWSVVAEQFRVAATRLVLLQSAKGGTVTVVTSAVKGEGKSVVAANLAFSLARDLRKMTLLVEGDLKCPRVHRYMGTPQTPGLRDVLQQGQAVESSAHRVGDLSLWVLPSGAAQNRVLDLSNIGQIGDIVSKIRGQYDHIIIDAPPILPLADMHVLASMADTLVLVIRAGLTPRRVVESAIRALGMPSNACIILNGLETTGTPYYLQEGYEYFRRAKEAGMT